MVYFEVKPVGELIREFCEFHKGAGYLDEIKLISAWPQVVGSFVASHTIDISIKNRILFVRVDSDALRSELSYSKSLLVNKLNELTGNMVIDEIVLN